MAYMEWGGAENGELLELAASAGFDHVDPHSGLAVYDQIVRQVKFTIADGTVRTGEMVPSIRELATELAVTKSALVIPTTRFRS